MSVSTDALLVFGIAVPEDAKFPWDEESDPEDWWRDASGFVPSVHPFDEDGNFADGIGEDSSEVHQYFDESRVWREAHPFPVEVHRHCSDSFPMFILSPPGSGVFANRGYPIIVGPQLRERPQPCTAEALSAAMDWIRRYMDPINPDLGTPLSGQKFDWILASYWG